MLVGDIRPLVRWTLALTLPDDHPVEHIKLIAYSSIGASPHLEFNHVNNCFKVTVA